MKRLAIVGSGPMALYSLKHIRDMSERRKITVFEATNIVGTGMPYRVGMNADTMLSNAFSREIPSVTHTFIDWLKNQPSSELSKWGLSQHELSARAFYPRLLVGAYLQAEFEAVCEQLRQAGHEVRVLSCHKVIDVIPLMHNFMLQCEINEEVKIFESDDLFIATGHVWPEAPEIDGVSLVSPWPYTNVTSLPPTSLGVVGSSLSAIDSIVALGHAHGNFKAQGAGLCWQPNAEAKSLMIRMVSKEGVMPEGDFYYPLPYTPLTYLTEEAVAAEIAKGTEGLLERVFTLLLKEFDATAPDYLPSLGENARSLAGFGKAYFKQRQALGGLEAVKRDFVKTCTSIREKVTIAHRYTLLRGHEIFGQVLRDLTNDDYTAFQKHLMPVFADCYAVVPHVSLAKVLALYDAGVLTLQQMKSTSAFREIPSGGISIDTGTEKYRVAYLIDTRGQKSASLSDLPFKGLVSVLKDPEALLLEPFRLDTDSAQKVYCLAMPQLLERYPFSQGLAYCHDLSQIAVSDYVNKT